MIASNCLTCPDLDVAAEHPADGIAGHASIGSAVHILPERGRRKWQKDQRAVPQHPPHPRYVVHRMSVRGRPIDVGRRASCRGAVQPGAARIRKFHPRRRLHHEARAAQMRVEAVATRGPHRRRCTCEAKRKRKTVQRIRKFA